MIIFILSFQPTRPQVPTPASHPLGPGLQAALLAPPGEAPEQRCHRLHLSRRKWLSPSVWFGLERFGVVSGVLVACLGAVSGFGLVYGVLVAYLGVVSGFGLVYEVLAAYLGVVCLGFWGVFFGFGCGLELGGPMDIETDGFPW